MLTKLQRYVTFALMLAIAACTGSSSSKDANNNGSKINSPAVKTVNVTRREGAVKGSGRALKDDEGEFNALGVTMMWALWAYKYDRPWLERNLEYLANNGFDYIRALGVITRTAARPGDYWYRLDMNASWSDYDQMIAGLTDLAYDTYGLRVEWTIFGGAADFNENQKQTLIDKFIAMSKGREQKIMHFEVANEYEGTGWYGDESLRNWTRYLNGRTDILVAASAAYETEGDICGEFGRLYSGNIADIGTWHFDRDTTKGDGYWRPIRQPWEYPYCPNMPMIGSNNEPMGPGSSVAADDDPMRNVAGALVSYISGLPLHVFHSEAGVRADRGDYTQYKTEVNSAFRAMKLYVPKSITNWQRENHHWAGHPFTTHGEIGYPPARGSGAVRNYAAHNSEEFFSLPMGIVDYLRLEARSEMKFCVIHPTTGEVLSRHHLQRGQTIDLRGLSTFVVKGRYGSGGDGCADSYVPGEGGSIKGAVTLKAGQRLAVGQSMKSPNRKYELNFQGDSNLVLYTGGKPVWASDTPGKPDPSSVEMQGDGNFVMYTKAGTPIWASDTPGHDGAYLSLDNSGLLALFNKDGSILKVLYEGTPQGLKRDDQLKPGQSIRSNSQSYQLDYQGDGNLVLYKMVDGRGTAVWATYTSGPGYLVMQGDGNLVMYDLSNKPVWSSDTAGHDDSSLAIYNNGRLAILDRDGNVLKELHRGN